MSIVYEKDYRTTDPARRNMLAEVPMLARGMTKKEVLANFGFTESDLLDEDEDFQADFEIAFTRGRSKAKSDAINKLFSQMDNSRGGDKACLAYLQRFGEKWTDEDDGITGFSMNFSKNK